MDDQSNRYVPWIRLYSVRGDVLKSGRDRLRRARNILSPRLLLDEDEITAKTGPIHHGGEIRGTGRGIEELYYVGKRILRHGDLVTL